MIKYFVRWKDGKVFKRDLSVIEVYVAEVTRKAEEL